MRAALASVSAHDAQRTAFDVDVLAARALLTRGWNGHLLSRSSEIWTDQHILMKSQRVREHSPVFADAIVATEDCFAFPRPKEDAVLEFVRTAIERDDLREVTSSSDFYDEGADCRYVELLATARGGHAISALCNPGKLAVVILATGANRVLIAEERMKPVLFMHDEELVGALMPVSRKEEW